MLRREDSCVLIPSPLHGALQEDKLGATAVGMVTRAVSLVVDQVFLAPGDALDLAQQVEDSWRKFKFDGGDEPCQSLRR